MGLGEYRWKIRQHMNRNGLVMVYLRKKGKGRVVLALIKYFTLKAHGVMEV
jgi:GTP cyclohydrolase II